MLIDTKSMVSITEANQNFSKVAKLVDEVGSAVIMKNNMPKYVIIGFDKLAEEEPADDLDVEEISRRLMQKNKEAYEVLAR